MSKPKSKQYRQAASAPNRSSMFFERMEPKILLSADALSGLVASDPFASDDIAGLDISESVDLLRKTFDTESATDATRPDSLSLNELGALLDSSNNDDTRQEIIFVDAATPDYQQLLDGVKIDEGIDYQVYILQSEFDGIEQITEILSEFQGVDAVHLISHGSDAGVQLGNSWLGPESLSGYSELLRSWSTALDADADILIYGCNLAAGASGQQLISSLAGLTGADVAASNDLTGAVELDGDWELEHNIGKVETQVVFTPSVQQSWAGVLNIANLNATQDSYIDNGSNLVNYGTSADLLIDHGGAGLGDQQILVQFDLGSIPAGATINSASLVMESTASSGGSFNINVYEITTAWNESTVTWNTAPGVAAPVIATLAPAATGQHSWDITTLVQNWVAGSTTNNGIQLGSPDPGGASFTYDSREGITLPQLVVDYTSSNNPPTGSGSLTTTSLNDNAGNSAIFGGLTVSDPDVGESDLSLRITLSDPTAGTINGGGFINLGGGVYERTGMTVAQANTALDAVQFTPTDNSGSSGTFTTDISVDVDDQGGAGYQPVLSATTVTITPINDAPTATNLSSTSSYNEDDASVAITDIVVSDIDTAEVITATLSLADTGTGSLSANDGATYTAVTGVWTITDSVANVNTALANLVFTPNTNNDLDTSIAVSIDDGDEDASGPLTGTITLDVTPINDAPSATNLSSTSSYNEDDASVAITDIVVSDVDTAEVITATLTLADTATGSLSANDGATYTAGTGVWTLTGTVTNVNTALANLVFTPNTNNEVDTSISVNIDDGDEDGGGALTGTITLDVTPINDAPSATNLNATSNYTEGDPAVALNDIVITDVDNAEIITASLTLANVNVGALSANDGATYDPVTGEWIITGTVAQVNTALANLNFVPSPSNVLDTSVAISIDDADEDNSGPLLGTLTLDVNPLPPVEDPLPVETMPEVSEETTAEVPEPVEDSVEDSGPESPVTGVLEADAITPVADTDTIFLPDSPTQADELPVTPNDNAGDDASAVPTKPAESAIARLREQLTAFNESFELLNAESFIMKLNDMREELVLERQKTSQVVGGSLMVSAGFSVGYVVWLARSGVLLSSALSSLPAWRFIDPLPVLATLRTDDEEEDEESLETMVKEKKPDA